jgi:DNA (cytosine-5)-methyltransferase 1
VKIYNESVKIIKDDKVTVESITTITTKQDRNPNSGLIEFIPQQQGKSPYRNLTSRECFLLMGFDEVDYQKIIEYNFPANVGRNFFTDSKLIKMAGNSIVVNVLEAIFKQITEIEELVINKTILAKGNFTKENSARILNKFIL